MAVEEGSKTLPSADRSRMEVWRRHRRQRTSRGWAAGKASQDSRRISVGHAMAAAQRGGELLRPGVCGRAPCDKELQRNCRLSRRICLHVDGGIVRSEYAGTVRHGGKFVGMVR